MNNMELETNDSVAPQTDTTCGPGCDYAKPAGNSRIKVAVTVVALLAVAGIVGYKLLGPRQTVAKPATEAFAPAPGAAADTVLPEKTVPAKQAVASPPEYSKIAPQITLPGLIVMSKGRGIAGVQGDITEDKILQAYVASSRAGRVRAFIFRVQLMLQWATTALQSASMGPAALPLSFFLGLVSAIGSACCTLPAMGMLVAYSGTRQDVDRRSAFTSSVWFLIGTTLALIVLGLVAGLVGQAAQAFLGRYWKLFAGVVAILVGLATLQLFAFRLPGLTRKEDTPSTSGKKMGAALGGLFLGGGVGACSLPCNPGIFIVIGASLLMGRILWGMALMTAFAVGFSLPLSAILFGVSFGKASIKAQKVDSAIRTVAGILLICAGFYLLVTF
ncbi:hypothetical protein HY768_03340 [candidate division TA06 bacterium]|uniref:Cytochrome C biogenesis protein transmembrane domain-containing protein n=1 Tax=candidate division TA06 bacterium TaxID=2250710 RepID=A0A933IAA9_UNCT6|nr:hypothetical protein [candidate division TA06 bacterium]